jgi:hypothetical protein
MSNQAIVIERLALGTNGNPGNDLRFVVLVHGLSVKVSIDEACVLNEHIRKSQKAGLKAFHRMVNKRRAA